MAKSKILGETKDSGFQFGLRKTFNIPIEEVWDFMFSANGLKIWLGSVAKELVEKEHYKTKEGTEGEIRLIKEHSHIRLTWKKKGWDNVSQLQVRIMNNNGKTVISFHQDHMLDVNQRSEMDFYWNKVMEKISKELENKS
ncbi:MAG: SRPBCC domain-containing protein [Sporocytophaga sp.]|uniref:SRPBCC domain-containing protein n=1 Tax=Sporocytophaga sp. TaxID=2231183 RepID=UPI001B122100|nr:SRPBCC domain-containing protein [Sporocytophaga sp.]MBO9702354.1 SRPBCC domain-containing protein [Sporocytophaga sp.]